MLKPHHRQYLAAYFLDFALITAFTAMPFFIFDQLGGGAAMSGSIAAFESVCYAAVCLGSTRFLGKVKNGLNWARVGAAGFGLVFPLAMFCRDPFSFAVVALAGLTFRALFWPSMQAWIGAEPNPALRTRRIAHYNVAWTLGLATGPLAAGPLYDLDYRLPFIAVFVAAGLAFVMVLTLPDERRYYGAAPVTPENPYQAKQDRASELYLYSAWFANMVGWSMVGVMRSVFPKRVDDLVEAGELVLFTGGLDVQGLPFQAATQFSWVAFVLYLSRAGISLGMGWTTRWHHQFWLVAVSQLAAGVAFWGLGMTQSLAVMMVCCAIVGVNGGVCFFASMYYSVANPLRKHRRAAVHESMVGIGGLLGGMSFGLLAERYGSAWPFLYTPVIVIVFVTLQAAMLRYQKRRAAVEDAAG
ncbi:MAG: MFS transporter [Candidatus Hydrogenedentota bacterium]